MKTFSFAGVGAILLLAVFVLGAYLLPPSFVGTIAASLSGGESRVYIGGIFILSGEGASWGEASRNGMELAIAETNRSGGINGKQLVGMYEDDGSTPTKAVSAFNKLTSLDKVDFIIGPNWSNTGLAVKDLATEAGVIMISPSLGVPEFNESSPYLFNTWPHDYVLSAKLGDIVYDRGHRTVALFGAEQVWVKDQTAAFKTQFEKRGGTIALLYEPSVDTTDERTELQKVIADKSIDALVMTTDGQNLSYITARQLRQLGSHLPLFNITVDKKIIAECGASCEGMIFPTFLTPTSEFETLYQKTYGREVEIGADSAYDAVMILVDAMRATGSENPRIIKEYLAEIQTYSGASGELTSDGKRAFTKEYVLKQVKNGAIVSI